MAAPSSAQKTARIHNNWAMIPGEMTAQIDRRAAPETLPLNVPPHEPER
jgi:hypothetical protein